MPCDTACVPSANPRSTGSCVRCGRIITPVPARDHPLEQAALADAAEIAARVSGDSSPPFPRLVADRLALGAQTYGDLAFLDRDNALEAFPEGADAAAYLLLEIQRLRPLVDELDWLELRQRAVAGVARAISLDVAVRDFIGFRDEILDS